MRIILLALTLTLALALLPSYATQARAATCPQKPGYSITPSVNKSKQPRR